MEARSNTALDVTLTINGVDRNASIEPCVTLLDLLREEFHLTGTKKGCDHGQCGACTVLVNGTRINSCLVLAVSRNGSEITTIEGIGTPNELHPLQEAFVRHDAFNAVIVHPARYARLSASSRKAGPKRVTRSERQ